MRHQKLYATMLGVCILSSLCMAEPTQSSQQKPKAPITLVKRNNGVANGRPKAPDRQVITCAYDGETLHLSFIIPEGTATLSVTDETLIASTYQIDTTPLDVNVPVGELFGSVSIELGTETGNIYKGLYD